ncbi:MAG: hypothetical protein L0226_07525 [Acidobacteria bacterium]|nr:hypothetical protein [Acidobacteriota bacterium]
MLKILRKSFELPCLLLATGACILSLSCAQSPQAKREPPPPSGPELAPVSATARSRPDLSPPKDGEINNAVLRVFKNAVIVETNRNPYFTVGDFNGDFSQDLAVVVKPSADKLPEINDELANWILVDPVRMARSSRMVTPYSQMHADIVKRQRVHVDEGDVLLAVIHGFESKGWRDPWATQTYVLKGAVGDEMKFQMHKQVVEADKKGKLPRIWGDVIAQTIGGQSGFLYYNGAKYAWYDPLTYKPALPARMAHKRASETTSREVIR